MKKKTLKREKSTRKKKDRKTGGRGEGEIESEEIQLGYKTRLAPSGKFEYFQAVNMRVRR